jgi:hypothetical protein
MVCFLNYFETFFMNFIKMSSQINLQIDQTQVKKYNKIRDEIDNLESETIVSMLNYKKIDRNFNHFTISIENSDLTSNKVCCNDSCCVF